MLLKKIEKLLYI